MEEKTSLIVVADPDPNVHSGFKNLLQDRCRVACFDNSEDALRFLQQHPGVAVVFSCFNLPGLGGSAFLSAAQTITPQAARVMLTGDKSKQAVKEALNEGHAFLFLEKPCKTNDLLEALDLALAHHRQKARDRALLERTLAGSVKLLIETLGLFHPEAFRRTGIVRKQALKIARVLGLEKTWELEMAVMLSPLGEAVLPKHVLARYRAARTLTEQERLVLEGAPVQARDLLRNIPQLERVSEHLYFSARVYDGSGFPKDGPTGEEIPQISRILKVLTDLWYASPESGPDAAAFEALMINQVKYDPVLLDLARKVLLDDVPEEKRGFVSECHIPSLQPGDVLMDDVLTENSHELVLSRGHALTQTTIRRLQHFHQTVGVRQPVRVERHAVAQDALRTGN